MAQQNEGCPIQSNIQHTFGSDADAITKVHDEHKTADDANAITIDDEFGDENDEEFDDEDGDGMMDDWGSIHSSSDSLHRAVNGHDDIGDKPVIGPLDVNPLAEGGEVRIEDGGKPAMSKSDCQRCWICSACNAMNNLKETLQSQNMRCCRCPFAYRPNVAIIWSTDWDRADGGGGDLGDGQIHSIWCCPVCTLRNALEWPKCDGCGTVRADGDALEISYSYSVPIRMNGHNVNQHGVQFIANLNAQNAPNHKANGLKQGDLNQRQKRKDRMPRIQNIGIRRKVNEFPARSEKLLYERRLVNSFGSPFQNKLVTTNRLNEWTKHCDVAHCRLEWTSYSHEAQSYELHSVSHHLP